MRERGRLKMKTRSKIVALYIRLSEEDEDLDELKRESNSVTNQRLMLRQFIKEHPDLEAKTAGNTGLLFQIALNYGGRDEIVRAVRKLSSEKDIEFMKNLTEKDLNDALDTAGGPDPDFLIRTCGEQRISNFLLWQLAYSEFYFADCAWPDFNEAQLDKALESYASRTRKFGGLVKDEK